MGLTKDYSIKIMTNEALQNLISSWIPELEFTEEKSVFKHHRSARTTSPINDTIKK